MVIKKFHLFENREIIDDIQIIKDIFQSFEEDHNSLSSEYIVLTTDREVLQYVGDGLEDGLDRLTQLEWKNYYDGYVNKKNVFKVKIIVPIESSNLPLVIDDSLNYLERIESEGFYCNLSNKGIASHIGVGTSARNLTLYYDILTKSDEYVKFLNKQNEEIRNYNFYFYFSRG